ncbi:MAG: hypothetical protein HRU33_26035 [Rhodobacteraceae bacterium]|nr:hypothetical protein [Paracoccaceae bacterium]
MTGNPSIIWGAHVVNKGLLCRHRVASRQGFNAQIAENTSVCDENPARLKIFNGGANANNSQNR